jgi:hypothetical protein
MKRFFIITLILLVSHWAECQYSELSLSVEKVESPENIQGEYIFLDKLGFLWVVSDKSSYRYDGTELIDLRQDKNFQPIISQAQKIIESSNYDKYFILYGEPEIYLLTYRSNKLISVKLPEDHIAIDAVLNDKTDEVFVLSYSSDQLFVSKIKKNKTEILHKLDITLMNPAGKIALGAENVFILTSDRVFSIDQLSSDQNTLDLPISMSTPTILSNKQSLHILNDRFLVFSHVYDSELFYIDLEKKPFEIIELDSPYDSETLSGVWQDGADNLIAAWKDEMGFVNHIYLYNSILEEPKILPVFDPTLEGLSSSDFNNKIFSVGYYNVNIIFPTNNQFKRFQDTLLQDGNYLQGGKSIRGIAGYKNDIYLLREIEHMFRLDQESGNETIEYVVNEYNDTLFVNCTFSLIVKNEYLWFSTCSSQNLNYLIRYNPRNKISKFIETPFRIKSISSYNDSTLLVTSSTSTDLSHIALFHVNSLILEEITELRTTLQSRDNTYSHVMDDAIFIGTTTGLRIYKKESWEIYNKYNFLKEFMPNHYITHIADDEKYIFFSSIDFGLVIYHKESNIISRIDKSKGLLTNAICATLRDRSNRYWISTFNGLYVLDQELTLVKAYFEEDGINHNEFNRFSYLNNGDKLYFGGINGYLQIDLDEIAALKVDTFNSYLSSVSYYDVETDIEQINIVNGNPELIELNPSQSNLKVTVALPVDRNRGNLIRVKINNGQNSSWTYLNEQTLYNIGNLPRGNYELIIQEKGPGLSWDVASTTTIPIIKRDFFYNAPLFRGFILFIIISSIFYYLYKRRKQKIELLEMRQRIAADLHDEIGSVLTGIASKAEILNNKQLYKESNDMDYFIKDSKKALEIMRDTIWSVNPAHDTLRSLTDRMKDFAFNMLSHKDIPIDYSINIENESCRISPAFRKDIYMIFKEAITNILKHSDPSKVSIKISSRNNFYDLYISNDGIKKESGDGSKLGLSSMDQRAKELGGQLNIKNGKSFIIQLSCPL